MVDKRVFSVNLKTEIVSIESHMAAQGLVHSSCFCAYFTRRVYDFPIYLSVIQSIKPPQELFEFPPSFMR